MFVPILLYFAFIKTLQLKRSHPILVYWAVTALFCCSCSGDGPNFVPDDEATCFDGIKNGSETGIDCGWACSNSCFEQNGLEGEVLGKVILDDRMVYRLTGPLIVRDGMELEIREGTIIMAEPGKNAHIAVAQGGKIYVYGQKDRPVVITSASDNPKPGDWGGLVICGKAPVNKNVPARSATVDIFYGGDDPEDGSGILRYLRIEYAGAPYTHSEVFNGVSFYGVGSNTTVEYVQVYKGRGGGFGFIGGTVSAKWLMATGSENNAYSINEGWIGNGTFWHASDIAGTGIRMSKGGATHPAPTDPAHISEVSIIGPAPLGALYYEEDYGPFFLENIYTTGIGLGINVDENAVTGIDENRLYVGPVQFDEVLANFEMTNYTGTTLFYEEGASTGSGNAGALPDWSLGWSKNF